jgi:phosphoribosyl 1,2-cyclic phosphodiesterase
VRITYFGVRGSCPCSSDRYRRYGGNTSCVLVEVAGELPLIIDLGTGLRALGDHLQALRSATGAPLRATVLLSHLHYDHVLGLPFFSPMRHPDAVVDVYGPAQEDGLGETLDSMVRPPFFPVHMAQFQGTFRFHELGETDEFAIGAVKVKVRSIPHIGRTLGFRLEADDRVLAYLSDHQAPLDLRTIDPNVLELCDGADLLLHDAQYTEDEFAALPDWGHSTPNYAVRVARESGAKRLALYHHDPAHSDDEIDRMLREARDLAADTGALEVDAATEGSTVDLGER